MCAEERTTMFLTLNAETRKCLDDVEKALPRVLGLKTKHKHDLPKAVEALSTALTAERGEIAGDYLQSPRMQSAYMSYFLPWNLQRLSKLLPGLKELDLPESGTLIDLGAGPLTMVLALWIARPELRARKLQIFCVDRSKKIMSLGLKLFYAIAGEKNPWRVHLIHGPVEKGLGMIRGKADVICMVNALNELRVEKESHQEERMEGLAHRLVSKLKDKQKGQLLLIEPGTRLGGRLISLFRKGAMEKGLRPFSPCTHQAECPMLAKHCTSWCHFNCDALGASEGLKRLTSKAGLEKMGLSLSYVFMSGVAAPKGTHARVISDPFRIPDRPNARYACSKQGLLVLFESKDIPKPKQGDVVAYSFPEKSKRDAKSGGLEANQA